MENKKLKLTISGKPKKLEKKFGTLSSIKINQLYQVK